MKTRIWLLFCLLLCGFATADRGKDQIVNGPLSVAPDPRYKTDILLIIAHPDDEASIASYLARVVFDQHKRIAVIYATRGGAGENRVGMEQGAALADVREIEARQALAALNISNVWFLAGHDTPGQDVLHSLESWDHGSSLENMVRLVRLTRPEIIITMLPDYVVGENHEDHQAAAVLAVEAADQAGDPLAFPEQVTAPRDHQHGNSYGEGLLTWQTKKIYFYDVDGQHDFVGSGPRYDANDISPSRKVAYASFTQAAWNAYQTQNEYDPQKLRAVAARPVQLIFGKSLVPSTPTADCLAGVGTEPIPYTAPVAHPQPEHRGLGVALGGPWAFYRRFWDSHGLLAMEKLGQPLAQGAPGEKLWIPLILSNDTASSEQIVLKANLPSGWKGDESGRSTYLLAPHEARPVQYFVQVPNRGAGSYRDLSWELDENGRPQVQTQVRVYVLPHALMQ
ncbi:MAG: PIG-L family deacetylase [Sinobacteraceae bacterium]|nr:PIG-L family deacetylase [Nevskiaceae bacterium]MBV9914362.1 PIG-L family deacetylase [Nevskiaceae bacterium]